MPFEERTMPSSRSVLTCKPAFPGGRFLAPLSLLRLTRDSNGSRRASFSPSLGVCAPTRRAGASTGFRADDFALGLAVVFCTCCEGFAAEGATEPPPAGLACASTLEEAAASKMPTTRMFTERIVRSFRLHLSSRLLLRTGCGRGARISRLGEKRGGGKDSRNGSARAQRVLCGLRAGRILEIQISHIDDSRQTAQPPEKVQNIEIGTVRLNLERHIVVVFARDHRLRGQTPNLNVRRACRALHLADEFVDILFFRHDGLQRFQLLGKRVHLRLQLAVTLPVNLELGDFLVELRALPDGFVDFIALLGHRR